MVWSTGCLLLLLAFLACFRGGRVWLAAGRTCACTSGCLRGFCHMPEQRPGCQVSEVVSRLLAGVCGARVLVCGRSGFRVCLPGRSLCASWFCVPGHTMPTGWRLGCDHACSAWHGRTLHCGGCSSRHPRAAMVREGHT